MFNQKTGIFISIVSVYLITGLYALYGLFTFPFLFEPVDLIDLTFEGLFAIMVAAGLLVLLRLEVGFASFKEFLFGLSFLLLSVTTDTLDEIVVVPIVLTHLVEGGFQIIGFFLLVLGLRKWVSQSNRYATTDDLTGISTRRNFLNHLNKEIAISKRYGVDLSIIFFDIDHFKKINDSFGHHVGDEVLVLTVKQVLAQLREVDIFARFGGEEFVLCLPNIDLVQAQAVAEKIRASLGNIQFKDMKSISASFGVAQYRNSESDDELLKRADDAMYEAKDNGRNCVVVS